MQRIDTATAIDEKFTDGNPETGRKATQFNAAWCNAVQEEIANAIEKNGEVLEPKDSSQLFRATSQLKTFECEPGNFDFGEWRGSSIVRVKTLGDLIFPAKAKCPKSATVLVVFPWLADSGTSVTVAQVEGSPFGCLRGNVAFGFFDENGSLSGCFNIPQWAAFSIASFGLLSCESLKVSGAINAGSGSTVRSYTNPGGSTTSRTDDYQKTEFSGTTGERTATFSASGMIAKDKESRTLVEAGLVQTKKVETETLSTTGAVTAGGKLTVKDAASVSGQLDVSGPANLPGGANVGDLKISGSVQFPSGNGLIPTLVYNIDSSRGDILSNYIGTDRNVFILLVNVDSASHGISYTSQEAAGPVTRTKQIAVGDAGLFYIDGSGNAAPVS